MISLAVFGSGLENHQRGESNGERKIERAWARKRKKTRSGDRERGHRWEQTRREETIISFSSLSAFSFSFSFFFLFFFYRREMSGLRKPQTQVLLEGEKGR